MLTIFHCCWPKWRGWGAAAVGHALAHPWQLAGAQPGLGDCHLVDPYPLASGSLAESRGAVGYEVQEPATAVVAGQRCTELLAVREAEEAILARYRVQGLLRLHYEEYVCERPVRRYGAL